MKHKIAIFASGSGTNAENIARTFAPGMPANDKAEVAVVLTNKADAGVHQRMKGLGIPTVNYPNGVWAEHPEVILAELRRRGVTFVALAGFLRQVAPLLVEAFPGAMVNIHPALLPRHGGKGMYGMRVHRQVVEQGDTESGATVHYVTAEMDRGPRLLSGFFAVEPSDTPDDVARKVHPVEYAIFPTAILMALDRLG